VPPWTLPPLPQNLWTKDLDKHLFHLRNVAQLKWGDVAKYFPTMSPNAVKLRHKQLSVTKEKTQDEGDHHSALFVERSTAGPLPASTSGRREPKVTKHYHGTSGPPAISTLAKPYNPLHWRRKTRQASNATVTTSALPTRKVTPQLSSRCGRPIRHPFRHRPQEGYL